MKKYIYLILLLIIVGIGIYENNVLASFITVGIILVLGFLIGLILKLLNK